MLDSIIHAEALAREYAVNVEDVLLIAINACGVESALPFTRMRFELALRGKESDPVFLIVSLGRRRSPFRLTEDALYLRGEHIGSVRQLAHDDVVLSYWRNDKKSLTLNSNGRSQCTGCIFCPNTLEHASDPRLAHLDDLSGYLEFLQLSSGQPLRNVDKITVCSGCFHEEELAIGHMEMLARAASRFGFAGEYHILSSVVRSRDAFRQIATTMPRFHLTLTAECFDNRATVLKRSKADLTVADMRRVLGDAMEAGLKTDITYIVGLDACDRMLAGLTSLVGVINTFPRLQVFQAHNSLMDQFGTPGSEQLSFFLSARRSLEALFASSPLRPQSWENYRPLWYYTFAGSPLTSTRC